MTKNDLQKINLGKKQIVNLVWQNIAIEVTFDPVWLREQGLVHICIHSKTRERLPVTETGFKSAYFPLEFVAEYTSIEAFINEWLDEFALSKEWQNYIYEKRQLSLF